MMVVDLMHEFELGIWKTLFTHLIRILHAASERSGTLADELNARWVSRKAKGIYVNTKQIPTGSYFWPVYNPPISQ